MKTAIVHEWLVNYAGSEKVVESFTNIWPDADVFTLVDFLDDDLRTIILKGKHAHTSFIQHLPYAKKQHRKYLPLFPRAVESFNLKNYKLIISSSHAVAKGARKRKNQLHISYCHSPMRYAWDEADYYLQEANLTSGFKGVLAQSILKYLRKWDVKSAKNVDYFIANSNHIAAKIEPEQKLYDLVTKRFLAIFYPAAEFLVTTRITRVEAEPFKSEGKVMVNAGWLAVYGKEAAESDDTPSLVPVKADETVKTEKIEVEANQTKPPPRYSEATLLGAMEGAGKLVEDEELREAMSEKGLGTPATRAQTIEGLIWEKYVHRNGRELQPTAKAFSLITLLRGLDIPELCSPELTGDWEFKLRLMSRGKLKRVDFMKEIADATREIVAKARRHESDTVPGDYGKLNVPCPKCGGEIHENYKKFQCQKCDFALWKIVASRQLEISEAEELIRLGVVGPLQGFRSKMGKPFAAVIKMGAEFKPEFDFGNDQNAEGGAVEVDFTGQMPLGKCPACGSRGV